MKRRASLLIMCALLVAGGSSAATEMVSMRDGIHLATDVFLPDGEGPWPAILLRSPYGRLALGDLTRMGYVVVSQDMRGYGGSEGLRTPFETDGWGELQDGYDTLEWISAQPWSDGRVGTWGGSALGITQNLLAGSHPEGLSCQFILAGASDLYSQMFFQGGAYRKSMIEGWWRDNGRPSHLAELLAHPSYDARWAPMNSDRRAAGMSCAGLHVGGWYDIFLQGTLNAFMERQHAGGEGSRGEQKLVMGPWYHGGFASTQQGELAYPANSLYAEMWTDSYAMYDFHLKGSSSGWESIPTVRYYTMGDVDDPMAPGNEWRAADDWPVPYTNLSLYLSASGLSTTPGSDGSMAYSYDPEHPVPTIGGANLVLQGGPADQRPIENRADVLVFSTPPLEVPIEVTGRIWVQIYGSSSCPDTDMMAKLTDVYPDGRSMLVLDGAIRAARRESLEEEALLVPGEVEEFWIDLWSTSIVFNKGHRIRLAITSSNYPRFEANPNTGSYPSSNETRIAENVVHFGASNASRIILPLAGPDGDGDGVYDLFDPMPLEPGPEPSTARVQEVLEAARIGVSSIGDPTLKLILNRALVASQTRLSEGDLGGAGHLVGIVEQAIPYDPHNITSLDASALVESALNRSGQSAESGSHLEMLECIIAGWTLGSLTDSLIGEPGYSVLREYLVEEQAEMLSEGCRRSLSLARWLSLDRVRAIATRIHLAQLGGAPGSDLEIVQGMLRASRDQYVAGREQSASFTLEAVEGRLHRMTVYIPESTWVALILGVLTCLVRNRRRPDA